MSKRNLSIAVAFLCAVLPLAAFAYTPPTFVPLTLKKPDLTLGGIKTSAMLPCSQGLPGLRFLITVQNVGRADYSPAPANQALAIKGPSHTVKADLPFIAAGGSSQVEIDYAPQAVENAQYPDSSFNASVNSSGRIIESNYSNNVKTIQVMVKPVCLSPSAPAMPPPSSPGH
jgi:hypothetical protein